MNPFERRPAAGQLPDPGSLVDIGGLLGAYYDQRADPSVPEQRVAFGTSGHRGTSLDWTFNEAHVLHVVIDAAYGYTPTPAISHEILTHNRRKREGTTDGIVVTQPWRASVTHHAVTVHVQRVGVEQVADAIARRQRRGEGDDPLLNVFG